MLCQVCKFLRPQEQRLPVHTAVTQTSLQQLWPLNLQEEQLEDPNLIICLQTMPFLSSDLPRHADGQDLKAILEDLGSISSLPPMTAVLHQNSEGKRFGWLLPWRWISGLGWGKGRKRGGVELTVLVRGRGLENCTSAQVPLAPLLAESCMTASACLKMHPIVDTYTYAAQQQQ